MIKALAGSTGRTVERIKADKVDRGDLGLVAEVTGFTINVMHTVSLSSLYFYSVLFVCVLIVCMYVRMYTPL